MKVEVWPNGVVIVPESPLENDALRRWKERGAEASFHQRYVGGGGTCMPGYESWCNMGYREINVINVHFPDPDAPPSEGDEIAGAPRTEPPKGNKR